MISFQSALSPIFAIGLQVFASACAVSYNRRTGKRDWEHVSRLVLEGAYEGTLLAAAKGHSERLRAADEAGPSGEQVMTQNFPSLWRQYVCRLALRSRLKTEMESMTLNSES